MGEEPDRKRMTTTAREPREPFRREGRDSHARAPHSSSRSRRDDPPSPRRWRDDRRHESDRSHYRRRAEESANAGGHEERRNRPLQDAQAGRDDPGSLRWEGKRPDGPDPVRWEGKRPDGPDPVRWEGKRHDDPDPVRWEGKRHDDADPARWEGKRHDDPDPVSRAGKPLGDVKDDPPARHERSPRGTKRFSETREAWQPRSSFFQVLVFYSMNRKGLPPPPPPVAYVLCFKRLDCYALNCQSADRGLNVYTCWSSSKCQFLRWFSLWNIYMLSYLGTLLTNKRGTWFKLHHQFIFLCTLFTRRLHPYLFCCKICLVFFSV
ncbi:hypothetical protein ACQ4PT_052668 [Festuca glaucescens]